jgi:hypothetical protein
LLTIKDYLKVSRRMPSKYPDAIKEETRRLYGLGFRPSDIAIKLGIAATTASKWCAGISRGAQLAEKLSAARKKSDTAMLPDQTREAAAVAAVLKHAAEITTSHGDVKTAAASDFSVAYREAMLPRLVAHMERTLEAPPPCRTVADVARLDQVIQNVSGMNNRRGGRGGSFHLDVRVLKGGRSRAEAVEIDAEMVEDVDDGK